jgi:hypothetical protein
MRYSLISAAGHGSEKQAVNEDLVQVFERDGWTDIVLLDGATPLTAERHVAAGASDPAWFVRQFAADLGTVLRIDATQEAQVQAALALTRRAFEQAGGQADVPAWARPIATLSWVRVHHGAGTGKDAETGASNAGQRLQLYCLGDSKVLMRLPDGAVRDLDPFDNPQEASTQAAVAALVAEGIADPAARWARLLPMLRARRAEQNLAVPPYVLCLHPGGPFAARTAQMTAPPGSMLLVLSDGLYRLVDTYRLHTNASLLAACAARGLDALLDELRAFEHGAAAAGLAAKAADDASAVCWRIG